jgi:hypothetical protein
MLLEIGLFGAAPAEMSARTKLSVGETKIRKNRELGQMRPGSGAIVMQRRARAEGTHKPCIRTGG